MALVRQNALSLPTMNESWAATALNYEKENMTVIDYWCSPTVTSTDPARHESLIGRTVQVALEEYSNIVLFGTIKAIEIMTVEETFEKFGPEGLNILGLPKCTSVTDFLREIHETLTSSNPEKINVFSPLANILINIKPIPAYLKSGRGNRTILR
ncbi:MAG: hypothetical protein Q4C66_13290 [Lachnospiraceae bacterium]|nr:hypothetical protein [Lachnospiraceae bacterium]